MSSNYINLPGDGVGISSLNGLTGDVSLVAGSNITITPSGLTLIIAASGSGVASINGDTTPAQIINVGTAGTDFAVANNGTGTHTFNLPTASATNRGALSSADWSTFNSKQSALTIGNLTDPGTDGIIITGGTGAVIGSGTSIAQHVADSTHNGYLSSADWSTFNSKQAAGSYITALTGDATATGPGSAALTLATVNSNVGSFGTATQVNTITVNAKGLITAASNTSIQITESQVTNLTSDLAGKQATGNYITALTGDVTASGPGSVAATLATVNSNVGSFTNANITVNAKGLITAATNGSAGAVTSVALADSTGLFNITGSPVTSSGTLTLSSFQSQAANKFFAAPDGSSGAPTFRLIVAADIPTLNQNTTGTASNITASSNSTLTTLSSLSLPGSQVTGNISGNAANITASSNSTLTTLSSLSLPIGQVTGTVVTTMGAFGSTPNANGASISTNTLTLQPADATNPGGISTTTQTIAGNKTFSGQTAVSSTSTTALTVNTNALIVDATNKIIGVGVTPDSTVSIVDIVNNAGATRAVQTTGYGGSVGYRGRYANGTSGSPTAAVNGNMLSFVSGRGYGATAFSSGSTGAFTIIAGETFTDSSMKTYATVNTTPTGSVTSAESFRVTSTGVTLGPQSSSTAIHQFNGGVNVSRRTITANLTVDTTTTDYLILCNNSGAITVTLPTPTDGRTLVIKDIAGTANTNNVTIARHASEKIEGLSASFVLQTNWGVLTIYSDGTDWYVN